MIGFFDSGKGGLTTIADCIKGGYRGEIVYYADYKNAPFGNKSAKELQDIADNCINILKRQGASDFVCACNTISISCKFSNNRIIPLKIPFELVDDYSDCLFLGTTISVSKLPKWYFELGGKAIALTELATMIDNNFQDISDYLKYNIKQTARTVILGCTHYGLVKEQIKGLTEAKRILGINYAAVQRVKQNSGENLVIYLQKEKAEEYSSTLQKLAIKANFKVYEPK